MHEQRRLRPGAWSAWAALLASSGTLVCCALPALLVAVGAGAALSSLVAALPQIVWLSEHKPAVFGTAGVLLALAGWLQWRTRTAPCPADANLRAACLKVRRRAREVYLVALTLFAIGGWFAFALPMSA